MNTTPMDRDGVRVHEKARRNQREFDHIGASEQATYFTIAARKAASLQP